MRLRNWRQSALTGLARGPEMTAATRRAAEEIRDEARRRAPVRTGALRRSLTAVAVRDSGGITFRVGWDTDIAFYGPLVEFGTEHAVARPHLRPAADAAGTPR